MPVAEVPTATTAVSGRRERGHRGDIDGLRAIAILLVVAFHIELPGFPGGFIGVDVFFVISGYLITRNLLREASTNGRIGFLGFWAKRIRRLIPAMFLMLIVVFGLAALVISALDLATVAQEGRAAALYVSNIFYARQATDYFGGDLNQSLFLHTWSLGVEEQFYLLWPLLFGAACLATRRRSTWLRGTLIVGFSITFVASLTLCVALTRSGSPWAFFSLPTRAWEFAAAGLLAAWTIPNRLRHQHLQLALAVAGLALIAIANLTLSASTLYPGLYALLPVGGTILVIIAGDGAATGTNPLSSALSIRPAQWLGRVSYSWYLWHWPLILLAIAWLDRDSRRVTITAALASLGIAAIAHHWFENPLRFSPLLTRSKPRTYAFAAALTTIALLATIGVTGYGDHKIQQTEIAVGDGTSTGANAEQGAGTRTNAKELVAVRASRRIFNCPRPSTSETGIDYCEAGNADSPTTVFLMGDSHTFHWVPAFIQAADELGLRLVVRWRSACPSTNVPVVPPRGNNTPDCIKFQDDTDALLAEFDPQLVVLSNTSGYVVVGGTPAWRDGFHDRISALRDTGENGWRGIGYPVLHQGSNPVPDRGRHRRRVPRSRGPTRSPVTDSRCRRRSGRSPIRSVGSRG